jgi:hypothetical protein
MGYITLTGLKAMATTELTRGALRVVSTPWLPQTADPKAVRMNWVVVSGKNGCKRLRMRWEVTPNDD